MEWWRSGAEPSGGAKHWKEFSPAVAGLERSGGLGDRVDWGSVAGGGDDFSGGTIFCNGVRVSGVLVSRDVFVSHEF
jgi:hypothetical protein